MMKKLLLSLTLMMLLLTGCSTPAQDAPQAFPTDVVADSTSDDGRSDRRRNYRPGCPAGVSGGCR